MSITLPPLPDDFKFKGPRKVTAQELRARDIEVARVVLEAAAQAAINTPLPRADLYIAGAISTAIRSLKVSHAE